MIEHCYCFRQKHLLQNYFIFFQVNDDWHVTDVKDATSMKPAQIFVQGDLTWDQLQMLISKSTTADLLKVKFIYSEKATKFCEISTNYLSLCTASQIISGDTYRKILWPSQNK